MGAVSEGRGGRVRKGRDRKGEEDIEGEDGRSSFVCLIC